MIPKILHYCWYGSADKPESVRRAMSTWGRAGEGYAVRDWNERNCDLACNGYVRFAAEQGKWALVSDYFRLVALEREGGIYLDTDVECYRSFDDLLPLQGFMGYMYDSLIGTAVLGFEPHHPFVRALLELYGRAEWIDGKSFEITLSGGEKRRCNCNNTVFTWLLLDLYPDFPLDGRKQSLPEMTVFPMREFEVGAVLGRTHCVHRCEASWKNLSPKQKAFQRLKHLGARVPLVHLDALLRGLSYRRHIRNSIYYDRYARDRGRTRREPAGH